jgi:hypothetical protein
METATRILEEIMSPPTIATVSFIPFFLLIVLIGLVLFFFYFTVKVNKMVKRISILISLSVFRLHVWWS